MNRRLPHALLRLELGDQERQRRRRPGLPLAKLLDSLDPVLLKSLERGEPRRGPARVAEQQPHPPVVGAVVRERPVEVPRRLLGGHPHRPFQGDDDRIAEDQTDHRAHQPEAASPGCRTRRSTSGRAGTTIRRRPEAEHGERRTPFGPARPDLIDGRGRLDSLGRSRRGRGSRWRVGGARLPSRGRGVRDLRSGGGVGESARSKPSADSGGRRRGVAAEPPRTAGASRNSQAGVGKLGIVVGSGVRRGIAHARESLEETTRRRRVAPAVMDSIVAEPCAARASPHRRAVGSRRPHRPANSTRTAAWSEGQTPGRLVDHGRRSRGRGRRPSRRRSRSGPGSARGIGATRCGLRVRSTFGLQTR